VCTLGALLTGFLATHEANANLALNLKDIVGSSLWIEQLKAMGLTIGLSVVATVIIAYVVKALVGLRPDEEDEVTGLDYAEHGEQGYHYGE
jgi:Amt family ammonium transporter